MKAALHPFTAVLFHVASFALYPFGSRDKIFIITAHWLSLCVCTYPFVWICLSFSVCVVYMQPCIRTPTHVFVQMPFCGMSCLSVGYNSALESWCLTLQPQHHSVYLISVFACSLKLPRRKKGVCYVNHVWLPMHIWKAHLKGSRELKKCGYICQLILLCIWCQTWDCQSMRCYQLRGIQRGLKWPLIPEIGMILVCVSPLSPLGWNKNCDVHHFLLQSHILLHGVLRNNFQKLPSLSRFSEWE